MNPQRMFVRKRIRWQSAATLVALIVTCTILAYQGVAFSHVDQWIIGGAVLLMAAIALLFGRDAPEEPPQHGGP